MAWVLDDWTVNYHNRTWENLKAEIKEIHFIQDLIYDGNYNRKLIPKEWFCESSVQTVLEERQKKGRKKKRKTTT